MEIVRNSINIAGLTDSDELPVRTNGQVIQFSETETIFIPEHQPGISSIFQIVLKSSLKNIRKIKLPTGNTVVLDGNKTLKIIYVQDHETGKANFLEMVLPFYTFIEVPEDCIVDNINIYILDAYFELIDHRKIYSNLLYYIDVATKTFQMNKRVNVNSYTTIGSQNYISARDFEPLSEKEDLLVELETEYLY